MALPRWIQATRRTVAVQTPLDADSVLPPGAAPPPLPFTMERQMATQWCWAAVPVSVARFYTPATPWRQCRLVAEIRSALPCCDGTGPAAGRPVECDLPYVVHHPLCVVGHLRQVHPHAIGLPAAQNAPTIQGEIDGGRPVVCRIGWSGGGGHFIALHGYDAAEETIHVSDPEIGVSTYTLSSLTHAYRKRGTWTATYTTRP